MSRRKPKDWAALKLGNGVRLLLGWRDGRRDLDARPVRISTDIATAMIAACRRSLDGVATLDRRIYSGIPALEHDQYLSLTITASDAGTPDNNANDQLQTEGMLPEEAAATGQLLQVVDGAFEADDWLTKDELAGGSWLFYVVVVDLDDDGAIAFVRKYNPQRGLKAGRLQVAARGNTLTRFDHPLFNFDFDFDLIIAPDEIAIFNVTAFNSVFADIELAKIHVSEHVATMTTGLALNLTSTAEALLRKECETRVSLANRVRRLAHLNYLGSVTRATLRDALDRHQMPRDRLGSAQKVRLATRADVEVFFDLVEGLYYEADFTGEGRRADRFSVRSQ